MKNGVKIGAPVMEITKDLLLFTWKGTCVYQSWLVFVKHDTVVEWIPRFFLMKSPGPSGTESVACIIKKLAQEKPEYSSDDAFMQIKIGPTDIDPQMGLVLTARIPNFGADLVKDIGRIRYKDAQFKEDSKTEESTAPTSDVNKNDQTNKNLGSENSSAEKTEREQVMANKNTGVGSGKPVNPANTPPAPAPTKKGMVNKTSPKPSKKTKKIGANTPTKATKSGTTSLISSKFVAKLKKYGKDNGILLLAVAMLLIFGLLFGKPLWNFYTADAEFAPSQFEEKGLVAKPAITPTLPPFKGVQSPEPTKKVYDANGVSAAVVSTPTHTPTTSAISNVGYNNTNSEVNINGSGDMIMNSPGARITKTYNTYVNPTICANNPSHVHKTAKECTDRPAGLPDNASRHPDGGWSWEYTLKPGESYLYEVNPEWSFKCQWFNIIPRDLNVEYLNKDGHWETSETSADCVRRGNKAYRYTLKPDASEKVKLLFRIY